jgi:hypothetical protein
MPAHTERLTAAIGRSVRAIAARFRHSAKPHPELYGLLTESGAKGRPSKPDVSPEQAQAMQAYLPIGPSCC